jgi:hypothetical protein
MANILLMLLNTTAFSKLSTGLSDLFISTQKEQLPLTTIQGGLHPTYGAEQHS